MHKFGVVSVLKIKPKGVVPVLKIKNKRCGSCPKNRLLYRYTKYIRISLYSTMQKKGEKVFKRETEKQKNNRREKGKEKRQKQKNSFRAARFL